MIYQLQTIYEDEYERKVIAILSYIVSAFMILPVIIIFLAKCCTHVKYRVNICTYVLDGHETNKTIYLCFRH